MQNRKTYEMSFIKPTIGLRKTWYDVNSSYCTRFLRYTLVLEVIGFKAELMRDVGEIGKSNTCPGFLCMVK